MKIRELLELHQNTEIDINEKISILDRETNFKLTTKELRDFFSFSEIPTATIIRLDSASNCGEDYRAYSYISSLSTENTDYLSRFSLLFYKILIFLKLTLSDVLFDFNENTNSPTIDRYYTKLKNVGLGSLLLPYGSARLLYPSMNTLYTRDSNTGNGSSICVFYGIFVI